jgi:hypothetical protein
LTIRGVGWLPEIALLRFSGAADPDDLVIPIHALSVDRRDRLKPRVSSSRCTGGTAFAPLLPLPAT